MIYNKGGWAYIATPILSLLLLSSCDKTNDISLTPEPVIEDTISKNEGPVVELSLESLIEDAPRAMTFSQTNPRKPIVDTGGIDVLCIVRSSGNDAPIYRVIKWERDATVTNRIRLKKHRFQFPTGTTTAAGKKWYIMGVIGGTWDATTKQLRVSTENIKTLDKGTDISLDVPAVSKWVEIPTDGNGQFTFQDGKTTVTYTQMPFHSQGALVQHKVDNNTSEHNLSISAFSVVSTAFSFEGHYDLSTLPSVNNTTAGVKNATMLKWVPSGESAIKEYSVTNASIPEYAHTFQLPQTLTVQKNSTGDANKVMTFWVMPTGQSLDKARTNIFVQATAAGGSYSPKTLRLPAYGKNHTKVLKNGDFATLNSVLHRPKLAIEYMAEYNIKRNDENPVWGEIGTTKNFASSKRFASSHGLEAATDLRWNEAQNHGIVGYHLPSLSEWEGIIPSTGANGEKVNVKTTSNFPMVPKNVSVGGLPQSVKFQTKADGVKTAYALHFIDDANGNKMRVAYRYRFLENPAMKQYLSYPAPLKVVRIEGTIETNQSSFGLNPPAYPNPQSVDAVNYLEIQTVYIGAYFLGTIDDIAQDSWWDNSQRRQDLITRYLPSAGNRYFGYEAYREPYISNEGKAGTKFTVTVVFPWVLGYWLSDPGVGPYPDKPIPHNYAFISSGVSQSISAGARTAAAGYSVRLFSNK